MEKNNQAEIIKIELNKLRAENKQLNEQLIQLSEKYKESEAFKSNFFSNITNEIINPFTSIISISESILLAEKVDWPKTFSLITLIHNEALSLDLLLKNFLYAAKIEAGEIKIDDCRINIVELLNNIKESFKFLTRKKNIEIELLFKIPGNEKQMYFNSDPEKLKIILTNLLYMAIECSFENEKIELSSGIHNKALQIELKDYSSGVSSQYYKLISDKFYNSQTSKRIGQYRQGFGFLLSRSLLELMGGKIQLSENDKSDTLFYIHIPEMKGEITGISEGGDEIIF